MSTKPVVGFPAAVVPNNEVFVMPNYKTKFSGYFSHNRVVEYLKFGFLKSLKIKLSHKKPLYIRLNKKVKKIFINFMGNFDPLRVDFLEFSNLF